jgi:hypothetical protein
LGERDVRNVEASGSIPLTSTTIPKPGHAPGFFTPAKGQQWRGFAGGAKFDDHWQALIPPRRPPEFLSFLCFCLARSRRNTL